VTDTKQALALNLTFLEQAPSGIRSQSGCRPAAETSSVQFKFHQSLAGMRLGQLIQAVLRLGSMTRRLILRERRALQEQISHRLKSFIWSITTIGYACGLVVLLVTANGLASGQMQLLPAISTVAGNGTPGYGGDGSAATGALLNGETRVAVDSLGNLYIADTGNNVVREVVFSTGVISTIAGNGTAGYLGDGSAATSAELHSPSGVAVDAAGNLYIADQLNNVIRMVTATTGVITTVAGNGTAGYAGDGGAATSAELNQPSYVALDSAGDLYIADGMNNRIREVNAVTSIITTVAGNGIAGYAGDGTAATSAELNNPTSVAVDAVGYLYIADSGNNRVRKVNTGGMISTLAGNGTAGYAGDGGAATAAELQYPTGIGLDNAGTVYIADSLNNVVRMVNPGTGNISTVAGNDTAGYSGDNGPAPFAELRNAADAAISSVGNLYIADAGNNVIRKVQLNSSFSAAPSGGAGLVQNFFLQTTASETIASITAPQSQAGKQEFTVGTITGCAVNGSTTNASGAVCVVPVTFTPAYPGQRNVPLQVAAAGGNINFGLSGTGNAALVALTPGVISTVAGKGTYGYLGNGGAATSAQLGAPNRLAVASSGDFYIADHNNNVVRKVTASTGIITTIAGTGAAGYTGDGGPSASAQLNLPEGVAVDSAGNLYIADEGNNVIRKITAATGVITTVAGNGTCGYAGDGGPATSGQLCGPAYVSVDSAGNFYIADMNNNVIRKVAISTSLISTVAGNGTAGDAGDGGLASSAELRSPAGLAFDSVGNFYIAESGGSVIRKVTVATGVITTVAGNGTAGYSGDGGLATSAELNGPFGIAADASGNLYIADASNEAVREVNAGTGMIATVAGNGIVGYLGDGGAATSAELGIPTDVALDGLGNLYIVDAGDNVVRMVNVGQSQLTAANTAYGATTTQTVTVSNIGNINLNIPAPGLGSNPSQSGAFSVDASSSCPQLTSSGSAQTLTAGAECTYVLDFAPTSLGAVSGSVVLTDDALGINGSTQTVSASGTGIVASTTATINSSQNPSQYGQGSATVTVAPTSGRAVPAGTVQFSADGTPVGGAVELNGSGTATYFFSTLGVGTHIISGVYSPGSPDFTGSSATAVSQSVIATLLSASIAGTPTKVYDGTTTATLNATNFTLTGFAGSDGAIITQTTGTYAAATAGAQTVTASLSSSNFTANGSTNFANYVLPTIASGPGIISKAGTGTSLGASITSIHPGQTVTLTATVASPAGTPTSNVQFFDGTTALATIALSSGVAVDTTTLSAGATHSITAVYGGDTNFTSSSSSAVSVAVAPQDFTFALAAGAPSTQTVSTGGAANYQLVAAPLYTAFPGTVSFVLTGLPAGATYSFSPATLAASGGSTPLTLTVHAPMTAKLYGPETGRRWEPMLLGLLLLPLAGRRRMRFLRGRLASSGMLAFALLVSLTALIGLNACGGGSSHSISSQSPQSQSYTLTATATSGGTAHSTILTLVVQ
jgi:sugar lactone lactonase YvrE